MAPESVPGAVVAAAGHGRISTTTPPRRTCEDERLGDVPAQHQRADRREGEIDGVHAARAVGAGDGGRHLLEVAGLILVGDARPADRLVGLEGQDEVRVQRLQLVGDVLGLPQGRDAVLIGQAVHDAGPEDLVAQPRAAQGAAAWVDHVGGPAHVVHVGRPGLAVQDDGPGRVARHQRGGGGARGDGVEDHLTRHAHAAAGHGAAGGHEEVQGGRRLDADAGPFEQVERGQVHGLDGLVRPDVDARRQHSGHAGRRGQPILRQEA